MKPYLRPPDAPDPLPDGWVAEPAGRWNGQEREVAYDPRRHDVLVAESNAVDDLEGDLAAAGWEYHGTDGLTSLWVRDRVAAARAALQRHDDAAGRDIGGLSR